MIDYEAQRQRKRRSRKARPERYAEIDREAKARQRVRAFCAIESEIAHAAAALRDAGRRGVPWVGMVERHLRDALAAVERYREVR